ncbi:MAG: hypothetical protein HC844_03835 [Tabrizicola sp.]|nr:hypothetical protein [Tabrizicola sp.]
MPTFHQTCTAAAALFVFAGGALCVAAEPQDADALVSDVSGAGQEEAGVTPSAAKDGAASAEVSDGFRIIEMRTDALIRLIAKHHGLVPHVSDRVRGKVADLRLEGDVDAMMAEVARAASVDWFVFDGALEVSGKDETATRFLPLNGLSFADATQVLEDANLDLKRFRIKPVADGSAVKISGPPKSAEVVEALLALTTVKSSAPPKENMIVVRRGTFKDVETFGEAGVAQLNEDRKAGLLVAPEEAPAPENTAAAEESADEGGKEQPKE